jgi:diphthamide synthase subunit DPH2
LTTENIIFARPSIDELCDSSLVIFGHQCPSKPSSFSKILYIGHENILLQNLIGFFSDKPLYWINLNSEEVQEVSSRKKNLFLSQRYTTLIY